MEFKSVLSRKPVSEIVASQDSPERRLSKVLGPFSIAAMGIGAIIGAGIFVLTGTAAALYAGPAIVLSFMLAAIACGLVGLCYAELSAFQPVSGSSYTYTYAPLGELAAGVIGWGLILEYAMGERHPARRIHRALRLYRLRCRLELRAGGAAAA